MRIFKNLQEAASEIERDLFEMGVEYQSATFQNIEVQGMESFKTKELISYVYQVNSRNADIGDLKDFFNIPTIRFRYMRNFIQAEIHERLMGTEMNSKDLRTLKPELINPGTSWKNYYDLWNRFKDKTEGFDYTYIERLTQFGINWDNQIQLCMEELRERTFSRQCLITIWRAFDLYSIGGKKRVPCSIYFQFMIRNNTLYLIYNMRSCDFYNHWLMDVMIAIGILNQVSNRLNITEGRFIHQINSLHAFQKDYENRGIF